jgi:hypothetical protein
MTWQKAPEAPPREGLRLLPRVEFNPACSADRLAGLAKVSIGFQFCGAVLADRVNSRTAVRSART